MGLYGLLRNNVILEVDSLGLQNYFGPGWPLPDDMRRPGLPPPLPPPVPPNVSPPSAAAVAACSGCRPFIRSKCDGKLDKYGRLAYRCCIDFMEMYKLAKTAICVANCLQKEEGLAQKVSKCCDRNGHRELAHIKCYRKCNFFPIAGVPISCIEVGMTGLW